jgi:hypothetical protein
VVCRIASEYALNGGFAWCARALHAESEREGSERKELQGERGKNAERERGCVSGGLFLVASC